MKDCGHFDKLTMFLREPRDRQSQLSYADMVTQLIDLMQRATTLCKEIEQGSLSFMIKQVHCLHQLSTSLIRQEHDCRDFKRALDTQGTVTPQEV